MLDFRVRSTAKQATDDFSGRRKFLVVFMMVCMLILMGRAIDLQVLSKQFLKHEGDMRQVDDVPVSAYRGMIIDRNGEPLAISTPVESIWINSKELKEAKQEGIRAMEKILPGFGSFVIEKILGLYIVITTVLSPAFSIDWNSFTGITAPPTLYGLSSRLNSRPWPFIVIDTGP